MRTIFLLSALMGLVACSSAASHTDAATGAETHVDTPLNDLASPEDAGFDAATDAQDDAPTPPPDAGVRDDVWLPLVDGTVPVWMEGDLANLPAPQSECAPETRMRPGDATIAPPRPVMPFSVSRSSSQRVYFRWILPEGVTGTRIEICRDRCCTQVVRTVDVAQGTDHQLTTPLAFGVHFWRLFGRVGERVGSRPSATWEFRSPHVNSDESSSYDTLRDMDGDGVDEGIFLPESQPLSIMEWDNARQRISHRELGWGCGLGPMSDFDGDGRAEYVCSRGNTLLVASRVGSNFQLRTIRSPVTGTSSFNATYLSATDINGDGYGDLVTELRYYPTGIRISLTAIYLGSTQGLSDRPQHWIACPTDWFAFPVATHDLFGDGTGDILFTHRNLEIGTTLFLYSSLHAQPDSTLASHYLFMSTEALSHDARASAPNLLVTWA